MSVGDGCGSAVVGDCNGNGDGDGSDNGNATGKPWARALLMLLGSVVAVAVDARDMLRFRLALDDDAPMETCFDPTWLLVLTPLLAVATTASPPFIPAVALTSFFAELLDAVWVDPDSLADRKKCKSSAKSSSSSSLNFELLWRESEMDRVCVAANGVDWRVFGVGCCELGVLDFFLELVVELLLDFL